MKNLTLISTITIIAFFAACKKDTTNAVNAPLTGNWKLVANYISTGSPGQWHDATGQAPAYVNFNNNGTITGNQYADYTRYAVKDSVTLVFTKKNSGDMQNFRYQIRKDTLEMSPAGPIFCTEGCAVRFIKQ